MNSYTFEAADKAAAAAQKSASILVIAAILPPPGRAAPPDPLDWKYAQGVDMSKPYHEMSPSERLADRIARNREIDQRVSERKPLETKKRADPVAAKQKPARSVLEKFQEIKKTQGIDAASEFVMSRRKTAS